jgi:hypothetical protein
MKYGFDYKTIFVVLTDTLLNNTFVTTGYTLRKQRMLVFLSVDAPVLEEDIMC